MRNPLDFAGDLIPIVSNHIVLAPRCCGAAFSTPAPQFGIAGGNKRSNALRVLFLFVFESRFVDEISWEIPYLSERAFFTH